MGKVALLQVLTKFAISLSLIIFPSDLAPFRIIIAALDGSVFLRAPQGVCSKHSRTCSRAQRPFAAFRGHLAPPKPQRVVFVKLNFVLPCNNRIAWRTIDC